MVLGKWKEILKSSTKKVLRNMITGETRAIRYGSNEKMMERRGDMLQPIGKDKAKFFDRYPDKTLNTKGELVDKSLERETQRVQDKNKEQELKDKYNQHAKENSSKSFLGWSKD